jgi:chromosome segregation ATPase
MTVNGIKAENTELRQEVARLDEALAIEKRRSANLASEKADDRVQYSKLRDVCRAQEEAITRLTSENEKLGRDYQSARDAHDKVLAENEKLRAVLDILQAAMTAKKPIPLAFKKAIIEAHAALSGDKQ